MDFSGDIGLWQRKVGDVPEGHARRTAVLEALTMARGQAVLELGCGGGHLLRNLAQAVGDRGRAAGLDVSADQLAAAKEQCAELSNVELAEGSAAALGFEDAAFDAVTAIHVLEYIPEVAPVLAEARRVLKPGGKVAFVSVLWDHWRYHGAEPELNERVHQAWRAHCPHQMLPLELPGLLTAAGFGGVTRRPLTFFNGSLNENSYCYWAAKVTAVFVKDHGLTEAESASWLEQLAAADREGRFGFVSVPVLTTATAV